MGAVRIFHFLKGLGRLTLENVLVEGRGVFDIAAVDAGQRQHDHVIHILVQQVVFRILRH